MTKIFVEFFNFRSKFSIFWSKIFFVHFVSQDLPLCKKSSFQFENLILYEFFSILAKNRKNQLTPPYFGPLSWPPYDPDLSRTNFIGSENDSWEFMQNFKSIYQIIKKLYAKRSRGGPIRPPPRTNRVKKHYFQSSGNILFVLDFVVISLCLSVCVSVCVYVCTRVVELFLNRCSHTRNHSRLESQKQI